LFASADTVGGLCGVEGDNMVTWELNRDVGLLTISGIQNGNKVIVK